MKPVSLRFQCFGPYMAEQFIDFASLSDNGLFLICGETGAGKTVILDAMCYALYGKSSGGLRGDLSAMRCKLAGPKDETRLEFIFDMGNNRYCFTRSLKYGRKNLNDSHNCLILKDGVYVPLLSNPTMGRVNEQAEILIGLTYEQFCQVVILPQGQFEKLLVSKSEEKEKILVSLFHAQRWEELTDRLQRMIGEQDKELREKLKAIQDKLAEYGCPNLDALAQAETEKRAEAETLEQCHAAAEKDAKTRRETYENALLRDKDFQELQSRRRVLENLQARRRGSENEEALLKLADKAEAIAPVYDAYNAKRDPVLRAEHNVKNAQKALENAQKALKAVRAKQEEHEKRAPQQDADLRELTRRESAGELYRSLRENGQRAADAGKRLQSAEQAFRRADEFFRKADSQWLDALRLQDEALHKYHEAQTAYMRGVSGVLARELRPGAPCPVCGSTSHPAPAQPDREQVTAEQLKAYNENLTRRSRAVTDALDARTKAENEQNERRKTRDERQQSADRAKAGFDALARQKIPGIDTEEQLNKSILALRDRTDVYRKTGEDLNRKRIQTEGCVKSAETALDGAVKTSEEAKKDLDEKAAAWRDALQKSGLDGENQFLAARISRAELERRKTALTAYRTSLSQAQKAWEEQRDRLEGQEAPRLQELKNLAVTADTEEKNTSNQLALAKNALSRMEKDRTDLAARQTAHDRARETVNANLAFAECLSGRRGVSLQRYVLGVMLTAITAEANRLLQSVHGGRYRLYRTDEGSGRTQKRGLELEVLDAQNNGRRSVATLSGGEKFLVALSLAIGLSAVVQAQGTGMRLEAMFIDEGFGSLDSGSIGDAFDVLQGIQRSHGLVGIISHVERLKETIPSRIEVVKSGGGSRCITVR